MSGSSASTGIFHPTETDDDFLPGDEPERLAREAVFRKAEDLGPELGDLVGLGMVKPWALRRCSVLPRETGPFVNRLLGPARKPLGPTSRAAVIGKPLHGSA